MADPADDIRGAVNALGNANPLSAVGRGISGLGDAVKGMIPGMSAAIPKVMSKAPPRGDIELPKEPRLMAGSDKRIVAENIRLLINSGVPEEAAIMTAMRRSRTP